MPSVAEQLRHARERQKLSVYDVAEATKIRTDHVRALEEGQYEVFAAPVYVRGFVRSYAKLLKLDSDKTLRDLEGELASITKFQEAPLHRRENVGRAVDALLLKASRINWPWVLILLGGSLLIFILVVGYRTWAVHKSRDPLADLSPGLYDPPHTNVGETLPLPPSKRAP